LDEQASRRGDRQRLGRANPMAHGGYANTRGSPVLVRHGRAVGEFGEMTQRD
jgi:hypothetical protein